MTKKELAAIRRRLEPKLRSTGSLVSDLIVVRASDIAAVLDHIKELEGEVAFYRPDKPGRRT